MVESIHDTEEIVVKALGNQLKNLPIYAGVTIMGDGNVALILDVLGLAQRANVVGEERENTLTKTVAQMQQGTDAGSRQTLLVVQVGKERMAIPLALVARLEEFSRSEVEHSNGQDVVQYRDEIMPLIPLSDTVSVTAYDSTEEAEAGDSFPVVVYSEQGQSVGLIVDRILDIVNEAVTVQQDGTMSGGLLGTAVIQGQITRVLNDVMSMIDSNFFRQETAA